MVFFGLVIIFFIAFSFYVKRYKNKYLLYFVFGKKGCGKSTFLVKQALKYQKKGFIIYTNMPEIRIDGVRLINDKQLGEFVPCSDSVLLLDEVGMLFDNREFKSFRTTTRDFFKLQRHYKVIVFMASQTFDIDIKLRNLTDRMYLFSNVATIFSVGRRINRSFTITQATDTSGSTIADNFKFAPFWDWTVTYIPKYAKYFDSFIVPEMQEIPYTVLGSIDLSEYADLTLKKRIYHGKHLSSKYSFRELKLFITPDDLSLFDKLLFIFQNSLFVRCYDYVITFFARFSDSIPSDPDCYIFNFVVVSNVILFAVFALSLFFPLISRAFI